MFLLELLHELFPLKVPVSSLLLISRLLTVLGSLEYPIRLLLLSTPLFPHLTPLANPVSPLCQLAPPFPLFLLFLLVVQLRLPCSHLLHDINRPPPVVLSHGSMLISSVPVPKPPVIVIVVVVVIPSLVFLSFVLLSFF